MSKENIELRQRRVELIMKIEEAKAKRRQYTQEEERRALENERLKIDLEDRRRQSSSQGSVGCIVDALRVHVIDNDATVLGSEQQLKNIWSEAELDKLKAKLLKAVDIPQPRW